MEQHLLVTKFPANLKHGLNDFFTNSLPPLSFRNTQKLQIYHPGFEEKPELQLGDF